MYNRTIIQRLILQLVRIADTNMFTFILLNKVVSSLSPLMSDEDDELFVYFSQLC